MNARTAHQVSRRRTRCGAAGADDGGVGVGVGVDVDVDVDVAGDRCQRRRFHFIASERSSACIASKVKLPCRLDSRASLGPLEDVHAATSRLCPSTPSPRRRAPLRRSSRAAASLKEFVSWLSAVDLIRKTLLMNE
mmetsp:Transcript_3355/g.7510  ORF Transcript_3355/g.7510 Transcript_3355/m.7510 type:complete len:136 (-) Transcript_3355:17-424(-)